MFVSKLNLFAGRVCAVALLDAAALITAASITWFVIAPPMSFAHYLAATTIGLGVCGAAVYYCEGYGFAVLGGDRLNLSWLLNSMGLAFALALVLYFAATLPPRSGDAMAHVAALYFPLLACERAAFRWVSSRVTERVAIVGTNELGLSIANALANRRKLGWELVGFLSDEFEREDSRIAGVPVIGKMHEIEKIVENWRVDWIVVASRLPEEYFPADELLFTKMSGRRVEFGGEFYERLTGKVFLGDLRPSYLIFSPGFRLGPFPRAIKRAMDLAGAAIGLLLAGPVLVICAAAIKLDSRGPVFYRQERVGLNGRSFDVIKLRSMNHRAESDTGPVLATREDGRITRVGRVLRKTRLDEAPQLWNVLRGEMSLVGPRPERPELIRELSERYPYFALRSTLKPGLTGWAQIRHGYVSELEAFEHKLALDLYYMKYRSIAMDLGIMWRTLKTVVLLEGI